MGRIWKNYIKAKGEFKIFYGKGTGILSEITLGNIKKEKSKSKELKKGNKWGLEMSIDFTTAI